MVLLNQALPDQIACTFENNLRRWTALPAESFGSIPDNGIGITETAAIYLGYEFLSQFETVWGWPNHTIYLLQR